MWVKHHFSLTWEFKCFCWIEMIHLQILALSLVLVNTGRLKRKKITKTSFSFHEKSGKTFQSYTCLGGSISTQCNQHDLCQVWGLERTTLDLKASNANRFKQVHISIRCNINLILCAAATSIRNVFKVQCWVDMWVHAFHKELKSQCVTMDISEEVLSPLTARLTIKSLKSHLACSDAGRRGESVHGR